MTRDGFCNKAGLLNPSSYIDLSKYVFTRKEGFGNSVIQLKTTKDSNSAIASKSNDTMLKMWVLIRWIC